MSGTPVGQRTIFLVEEDDDVRPLIRQNLIREGYRMSRDEYERLFGAET